MVKRETIKGHIKRPINHDAVEHVGIRGDWDNGKIEDPAAQSLKSDEKGAEASNREIPRHPTWQTSATTSAAPINASTTPNAPPSTSDIAFESNIAVEELPNHGLVHSAPTRGRVPELETDVVQRQADVELDSRTSDTGPFSTIAERRLDNAGQASDAEEATLDLHTLKQAFATQYAILATKCQGWERYAAKLKAKFEAQEVDSSVLRESHSRQTETIVRQEVQLESQLRHIERLEAENADMKEVLRERENRSRDVESRLSSLEERMASRVHSTKDSTAASQRPLRNGATHLLPAESVNQHVQPILQHAYQPPSPPVSIVDHSQSHNNTIGPQHGRDAFHSSNIRYSLEVDSMQPSGDDLSALTPLDSASFGSILGDVRPNQCSHQAHTLQMLARPASRALNRESHQVDDAATINRGDEDRLLVRQGGRESRMSHRENEEHIAHHLDVRLGSTRFVDGNGSVLLAGKGPRTAFAVSSQSVGQISCSQGDDLLLSRLPIRSDHTERTSPDPPSILSASINLPQGYSPDCNTKLSASLIDHRANRTSSNHVPPLQYVRSISSLGLSAPHRPVARNGSVASVNTVTSSGQIHTSEWAHLRSSAEPAPAAQEICFPHTSVQGRLPLRRASLNQQLPLAQVHSRRNSATGGLAKAGFRLSSHSNDGTGQLPVKRGGSKIPSSRNGSTNAVHDSIPVMKDDIFSDGRAANQSVQGGAPKVSIGSVAKGRTFSTRPGAVATYGDADRNDLAYRPAVDPCDGRKSSLSKNACVERYIAHSPKVNDIPGRAPSSHFSPQSSVGTGGCQSASSSSLQQKTSSDSHPTNESIIQNSSFVSAPATSATAGVTVDVAAEARRGAHRRLYLCLREELSAEDLQKFERYVHRYDALEIPVDGPRGLINRVKKLLLLGDPTLRERSEDWKRRKELAREFEKVVSFDS